VTTETDFTSTTPGPIPVFGIVDGSYTAQVDLTSDTFSLDPSGNLTILGNGYVTTSNTSTETPISFDLTAQGSLGSFSATITTTPLPSTWAMLIASLLGVGLLAYRGSKKQSHVLSSLGASAAA
jgi:hypothetical protein